MAEYTAVAVQTVLANQNVLLTETPVCGSKCIQHRDGSGIVTLRGITNQCRARYRISFGANIAIPADGAAGEISLAIAIAGEPLQSAVMTATPTAVGAYFNVGADVFVDVPAGCCVSVAIENISAVAVDVRNANLIADRVA